MLALCLAMIVSIFPVRDHAGYEHRYAIINGSDFVIVGRSMFEGYERSHSCMRLETKRYPKERVIVRMCYV